VNVAEVRQYVSEDGHRVIEFVEMFGSDKGKASYKGIVTLQMRSPDPRMAPQNMPLEFAFEPGTTLKKAFELYDKEAEKAVEAFKKEQKERQDANKIIQAKGMPTMLGPNGKPMRGA